VNKSMLAGIGIGVAAALGVAAVAGMNVFDRGPQYAQVLSATPIKESIKQPRQECRNVTLTHRRAVQDENRLAGSVLGAVAGGVLGHQFGGGRGRDVATVAGAVAGGYAGNQVQGGLQDRDTYTTTEQRCKTVYDKQEKKLGYDVTYKIGDQQGKIRMENDPGTRIPLDPMVSWFSTAIRRNWAKLCCTRGHTARRNSEIMKKAHRMMRLFLSPFPALYRLAQ